MLTDSMKLISADDHLIEPPHLWIDRVPRRYRDRCPRIVEVDGRQAWRFEDELTYIPMGSCRPLPGFSEAGYPPAPGTARFDEIRTGCFDPDERIKDMDLDGVWGQLCFPNYSRFAGHRFYLGVTDHDLGLTCLQTYNDYLLREWCATDPRRLYGAAVLPLNDIEAATAELSRVLDLGARAIAFSENPTILGLPSIHTSHWDPLWAILNEAQVPICMHIGSSSKLVSTSDDAPVTVSVTLNGVNSMMAGVDWLMSGLFDRYPNLRIVLSEGGAGWIPYILERADKVFADSRLDNDSELGRAAVKFDSSPRELFEKHVFVCLVDEYFALRVLGDIPIDNLLWEGDYPHGDGLFPNNRDYLAKAMADVPDADVKRIVESNLSGLLNL